MSTPARKEAPNPVAKTPASSSPEPREPELDEEHSPSTDGGEYVNRSRSFTTAPFTPSIDEGGFQTVESHRKRHGLKARGSARKSGSPWLATPDPPMELKEEVTKVQGTTLNYDSGSSKTTAPASNSQAVRETKDNVTNTPLRLGDTTVDISEIMRKIKLQADSNIMKTPPVTSVSQTSDVSDPPVLIDTKPGTAHGGSMPATFDDVSSIGIQ